MKKIAVILLTSFLLCLFSGLISCTKKQAAETPFNRMLGKWRRVQIGTDDNNDGVIEASEIRPVPSTQDDEILFTNESNGVETSVDSGVTAAPLSFDWKIVGGDSVWVAYKANDTITYYLAAVSSHNLQLNTNTTFGLVAYYYDK